MLLKITSTFSWDEALQVQSWGFWLLLMGGIVLLYVFWERFWILYNGTTLPTKLLENIKPLIRIGDKATSLQLCKNHQNPSAKLLAVGVGKLGKPLKEMQDALAQEAQLLLNEYEKKMAYLVLFAEILPVLGLLVTLMQTQFFTLPFQFVHLLPFWLGWILGFVGNIGYNILIMRIRATKHTLDKITHLWLMFLQGN